MTVRHVAAVLALLAAAVALTWVAGRARSSPHRDLPAARRAEAPGTPAFAAARERARRSPFYRSLFARGAVRRALELPDGSVRLEVDLRALARATFARWGLSGLQDTIPETATVILHETAAGVRERWRVPCPGGCLLDAFATEGPEPATPGSADALSDRPSAVAAFRLAPARFRDLALGPGARRVLEDRLALIEAILGRPVRRTASEDLSGAGVAAVYRDPADERSDLLVALDLVRADRVRSLLDVVLGLGALTRGAGVRRHRDVPIGSLAGSRAGLAAAVDGSLLLVASDASRIEDAIDRRRDAAGGAAAAGAIPRLAGAALRLRGADGLEAVLTRADGVWVLESSGPTTLADDAAVGAWLRPAASPIARYGSADRAP